MPAALRSGEVDAIAIWEPESENAASLPDAIVLPDRSYRELFNLQTTTKVLSDPAKRRALVEFLKALITASEQVRTRPKEHWPLIGSKLNYSEAVISKSWQHHRYAGGLATDLLDVMEEEERWVAMERNRTPRPRAQLASLIDASLLAEAQGNRR
jgi:NitT/TauT family transport system substrate-binding protein